MTTREKIIVGIMLLTVGYGAVELLLPKTQSGSPTPLSAQGTESLPAFIAKVADMAKANPSEAGALLIQKAESAWQQDPFWAIHKAAPKAEEKPAARESAKSVPSMTYSGFLEIGAKRLAIINGMEYEAGDRLGMGGVTVKSVLPNKVILMSSQGEMVLPLQESD
jgi:hypothetical protein